ncbi:MAG TPA: protein adenylyltransferase SelO family protein, partial [Pseudomonadales bacterium]
FLEEVIARQARLIAQWLLVGFIHGVMNTDNVSIAGETIDFGPCAFMDEYNPTQVFSSIDQMGRYAYARQPDIAQWNLARFAETLLPLLADDQDHAVGLASEVINEFASRFEARWLEVMGAKLGLEQPCTADRTLIRDLLQLMEGAGADFTLTFRSLNGLPEASFRTELLDEVLPPSAGRAAWLAAWRSRLTVQGDLASAAARLGRANPLYIPRNHRVEQMIEAAIEHGDFSLFERLNDVLASPCEARVEHAAYARPPESHERVTRTFCGT